MKKLMLAVMLVAFTVAAQAGDAKTCTDKDKAACSKKSDVAKACCPASGDKQAKSCPFSKAGKETVSKPVTSPKSNS